MDNLYQDLMDKLEPDDQIKLEKLISKIKWSIIDDVKNSIDFYTKEQI